MYTPKPTIVRERFSCLMACVIVMILTAGAALAAPRMAVEDPYNWLEEVSSEKSLAWVKVQNSKTSLGIAATPEFARLEANLRAILDSDARIPSVQRLGEYYYNFWKDAQHERGIFRRTTPAEYRKPNPKWETILDIDVLNRAENANWVWKDADCLQPDYRRCLIVLSRGGADATITREFDLDARSWVKNGFVLPEAKGSLAWIDLDTVYVMTDFGPGSMTASGYPRLVKEWRRGTSIEAATPVYEAQASDVSVGAFRDHAPGHARDFIVRHIGPYSSELYLRGKGAEPMRLDVPDSGSKSVKGEWLTLKLRERWTVNGRAYEAGTLLAARIDDITNGRRVFHALFTPSDRTALVSAAWTRSHLLLNVLEDVKSRIIVMTPAFDGWKQSALPGAPAAGEVSVRAVDSEESDAVWMTATDFLTPTTLSLIELGKQPEPLKSMPMFFDASRHLIEQRFAISKDKTRIPYFLVRPRDLRYDGTAATLLSGYGGFEVSRTPAYSGAIGKAWLERGGVYVLANIRGGGEYGPRWHQAALRENRHKAYEDFAAVAQDLIASRITSPRHLGIQGGSNGGLLTGNMLTQYPALFGAIVIQVPLLDMKRYSHLLAGASWIGEYGNPDDPSDWEFLRTFSPYHLFEPGRKYPPVLFITSTRDDRVHPSHARKMAAKMIDAGKDVTYYENIEGGHGGAASNKQAAYMGALTFAFLLEKLHWKSAPQERR